MRQFVYDAWNSVMDMDRNPLRHIPDLQVRHMILQILAWMWATTFALWMGSIYAFGISTLAHLFLIAAIVVTVGRRTKHPKYGKYINLSSKYHVHDEKEVSKEGDLVIIQECRPLSKTKSWKLLEVIKKEANK